MLAEILRIGFGTKAVDWDNLVYGVLLVVFIIFLPQGDFGQHRRKAESATQALDADEVGFGAPLGARRRLW
jgi:hypothetical protein